MSEIIKNLTATDVQEAIDFLIRHPEIKNFREADLRDQWIRSKNIWEFVKKNGNWGGFLSY